MTTTGIHKIFKSGPRKGQPSTMFDRVVRYMTEAMGASNHGQQGKYRRFIKPDGAGTDYFVGKGGAVRVGATISNSASVTNLIHTRMKLWEKEHSNNREFYKS